jgi:hypothetical protein
VVMIALVCACGAAAPEALASITVPTGTPATFTGSGTSGTKNAMSSFEAATGGRDNGTAAGEQAGGYRHLTWDTLAVDGSDPGSTVIEPGHVVEVSSTGLEPWGIEPGPEIAVANDGFSSVNSHASFTPFSAPNVWAPFNSTTADFQIVVPAAPGSTPVPAQTRGLGIVFLDADSSTQIQYYDGDVLLGQVSAPTGSATSFAGLLFSEPLVTRVAVTLGSAEIFSFDGTSASPGGTSGLVAGDDIVLSEPAQAAAAASAGVPVTATLDTFSDTDPSSTPSDFTATIDWGDGSRSAGTIASGAGGTFVVTGSHTYAQSGDYDAEVTVSDYGSPPSEQTSGTEFVVAARSSVTTLTCSPAPVAVSASTACTAFVYDVGAGNTIAPTGTVAFSSPTPGASFDQDAGCVLGSIGMPGVSACQVNFIPQQFPPGQAKIVAAYGGDGAHAASGATAIIGVKAQRCTLKALKKRLVQHPVGLALLVTCDARANVAISAAAVAAANRGHFRFSFAFGALKATVAPGRPTVLVIRAAPAARADVRAAKLRHQRLSVKLTLTAASHATHTTTTTRVSAVRLN